jgi:hypothetical protein
MEAATSSWFLAAFCIVQFGIVCVIAYFFAKTCWHAQTLHSKLQAQMTDNSGKLLMAVMAKSESPMAQTLASVAASSPQLPFQPPDSQIQFDDPSKMVQ